MMIKFWNELLSENKQNWSYEVERKPFAYNNWFSFFMQSALQNFTFYKKRTSCSEPACVHPMPASITLIDKTDWNINFSAMKCQKNLLVTMISKLHSRSNIDSAQRVGFAVNLQEKLINSIKYACNLRPRPYMWYLNSFLKNVSYIYLFSCREICWLKLRNWAKKNIFSLCNIVGIHFTSDVE